jgi:hypothetical protein
MLDHRGRSASEPVCADRFRKVGLAAPALEALLEG